VNIITAVSDSGILPKVKVRRFLEQLPHRFLIMTVRVFSILKFFVVLKAQHLLLLLSAHLIKIHSVWGVMLKRTPDEM